MLYRFIFRLVYRILSVIASIISSIILPTQKVTHSYARFLCMILYVFKVHTPILPTTYIPLKMPPGEDLEGPFLISVRLNSGPAAVYPVDNWFIDQIPAVFNLNEVKTGTKCW